MDTATTISQLQKIVFAIHPLPNEVWQSFSSIWQPYDAKRKTVLTAAGETEKHLYFVTEGVQRAFYLTTDDREATLVFTYPFSFSGVLDSFLLQQPSRYYLETLTQSHFLRTTYTQVSALMELHHSFETFIRKALSQTVAGVLERQIELQCFTAEQKFTTLLKRSPQVLQLIQHKYLTSYLGLDAATFSKLMNKVRL